MARPLEYVLEEIVRVSEELGIEDPRLLCRKEFLLETDVTKHDIEKYGTFTKLKNDAAHVYGVINSKDMPKARGVDLRNNYVRSLERKVATADYLSDKLLNGVQELFERYPIEVPKATKLKKPKHTERVLTLLWSDLHFGVDVDSREVLKAEYNWTIASRRMSELCKQAVLWKPEYRDETTLQIVLNGDILHGIIHLSEANIKEIQEQIWGATAILSNAIGYLRQYFGDINVLCLPGNHDRVSYRTNERALSQRWNSHSHSVYLGLKIWFKDDPNVNFDIPMSGMGTYTTPGNHTVFATHGDTEPSITNVSKSFDVSKATQSLLKLNVGNAFNKVDVALFGHWHQPSMFMLPDGTFCIVNGSLIGSETFAQNGVGFFNTVPAQVMFESVEDYSVRDFTVVQLGNADTDESLDDIIYVPGIEKGGLVHF